MNIEYLGTLASVFVLISFTMSGEKKIRLVNIIGATLFVVYGRLIGSFSVTFLNGVLLVVHINKLNKLLWPA